AEQSESPVPWSGTAAGGAPSAKTKGAIPRWHVVGPFDIGPPTKPSKPRKPRPYVDLIAPPKESWYFGRVLPPEKRRDPTDVYPGKKEGAELRWEILPSDQIGVARLDYYYGRAESTAYCAVAYVHAPAKGTYEMDLNSYNHVEVWVAGRPVGALRGKEDPQQRLRRAPERGRLVWGHARFPAELAPGWNEVFLKVGDGLADRVRYRLQIIDPESKLKFGMHHDVHAR
ncbi:MAG: hypothetical protein ACYTFI_03215, partial [Planctomycetota bacterium]